MIEEAFGSYFDFNNVVELWPNYSSDELKISNYIGTNIRRANILLNSILDDEEKKWLESLFFETKEGWYRYSNSRCCIDLKLSAMSLGLTNTYFTFNPELEDKIEKYIRTIPIEEQELSARCYIKQKVVTYYTLRNYLKTIKKSKDKSIILYRGLSNTEPKDKLMLVGMESWTLSYETAHRFAGNNGIVVDKEYDINQIFAGYRSTFKNRPNNMYRNNGFYVRREHEMIVENIELEYDCSNGKHIVSGSLYY